MKALYIDDEKNALKDFEFECKKIKDIDELFLAANINEGKKILDEKDVDILFLDINMPGVMGTEFAKEALQLYSHVRIIFVTAYDEYAIDAINDIHPEGYLLKPITKSKIEKILNHLRESGFSKDGISVKTFGNFDIFVDGKAVEFRRSYSKEILAYLIDKRGTSVTRKEIAAAVFETDDYSRKTQINVNQYIFALKNSLDEYGIGHIINNANGLLSVNMDAFRADFVDFINGDVKARRSYKGEYMSSYSWGEFTASYLDRILSEEKH